MNKKIVSILLVLSIILCSIIPAFAYDYPQGVTQQSSEESAYNLDKLVESLLKNTDQKNLSRMLYSTLYSDETLSGIFTSLYKAMNDYASALNILGVDVSPAALSQLMSDYPQVSRAIEKSSSLADIDLSGAKWHISSKQGFANAVAAMVSPFNDVLYMLLCSGRVNIAIIPIFGDDGYSNGIVPMLQALGASEIPSADDFHAQAANNKNSMIANIVLSLLSLVDDVADSPVVKLSSILPNLAYFFKSGQFADAVDGLLHPISLHIGDIITLVPATKLISILMFFSDTKKYTTNFTENMTTILNDALESTNVELAEIKLDELAACGTDVGNYIQADIGQSFAEIFTWLLDTVKLNEEKLFELLKENDIDLSDYKEIISNLLQKSTDSLFALLVKLLSANSGTDYDYQWQFAAYTPVAFDYGQDFDEHEMSRVADGIDSLLDEMIKENTEYKSLKSLVKTNIFSNEVLAQLTVGLYGFLGGEELADILQMAGFDFSPSAVASNLKERRYSSVRSTLYRAGNWSKIEAKNLNFGIKAGSADDFEDALVAILRPFAPLLRALLASDVVVILGSLHIGGSNGYNTAVIPLLEALGCNSKYIMNYDKFKKQSDGDGVISGVVHPIIKLLEESSKKPVNSVISILPNVINFISDGSLIQCLLNLLQPVVDLLGEIGLDLSTMGVDLNELKTMDLLSTVADAVPTLTDKVKLSKPDLKLLADLGSVEQRTSKATYQGSNYTYNYIVANKPAVTATILRYVMGLLQNEENADLLGNLMTSDAGDDDMFAQYSSGIGEQMAQKTPDENIAWLYRLFFHERIVEETTVDDYQPYIIYDGEKQSGEINAKALAAVIIIVVLLAIFIIINRRRAAYIIKNLPKRIKSNKEEK